MSGGQGTDGRAAGTWRNKNSAIPGCECHVICIRHLMLPDPMIPGRHSADHDLSGEGIAEV